MSLLLRVKALAEAVGADIKALANGKVNSNDPRLSDSREWSEATVPQAEAEAGTASTRRAWTAQRVRQAINAWWNSSSYKTKLDGVATGATANATNAQLRDRATHTGTQAISTVAGLQTSLDSKLDVSEYTASDVLEKLKTVDGDGSGLDADLLDGMHISNLVLRGSNTPIGHNTLNYVAGTTGTNNGGFRVGLGGMQAVRLNDSPVGNQWGVAMHMNAFYRPVDDVYGYTAPNQYIPLVSLEVRNGGVLLKTHPATGGTGNAHVPHADMTIKALWDSSDFSAADVSNWNTAYGWGSHANAGYLTTGNILTTTGQSTLYPMTQKAVTDAINARGFADASGVLTATSGALSNDMSSFLSQATKATMRSNLEVPQLNASATAQGGLKARLDGTTLYLSNDGTNP